MEVTLEKRAQRFGMSYTRAPRVVDIQPQSERDEHAADVCGEAVLRPNAVHVFNVDLLSTRDCLNYFKEYGPTQVEWINDSSANVVFSDEFSARRAVQGLGDLASSSAPAHATSWYDGKTLFEKGALKTKLSFRLATELDKKPQMTTTMADASTTAKRKRPRNLWRPQVQEMFVRSGSTAEAAEKAASIVAQVDADIEARERRAAKKMAMTTDVVMEKEDDDDPSTPAAIPQSVDLPDNTTPAAAATEEPTFLERRESDDDVDMN